MNLSVNFKQSQLNFKAKNEEVFHESENEKATDLKQLEANKFKHISVTGFFEGLHSDTGLLKSSITLSRNFSINHSSNFILKNNSLWNIFLVIKF